MCRIYKWETLLINSAILKKEEIDMKMEQVVKPFVKWAGGKTQLLLDLKKNLPSEFNNYFEPFVGGGALLFEIGVKNSFINDSNGELINCYKVIRDNHKRLSRELKKHKNNQEYFYHVRTMDINNLSKIQRAARFIFLNKTCYNGLWRVNKKNQFNTPFGKYKNPKITDPELLESISRFLKEVNIFCYDFEKFLLENAKKGDLVYFDPPYHPVSKYSDFRRYTKDFFGIEEQERLAKLFRKLNSRGCKLLLSNSHSKLILNLYKEFNIKIVHARRNINRDPNRRGVVKEVLVKNYG